jgi:NAD(P)-dependent dehydrogenase (short-subunit alcohol dehydrogenase family)
MKTALITGSSRGIGRAAAIRLAKDGYRVIIHGAGNMAKAQEVKEIIEQNGGVAEITMFNLCNTNEISDFAKSLGDIDVLVLNASLQYKKPWQEVTVQDCLDHFHCNYIASLMMIQAVVPHMQKQKWGRIITVGSVQEAKPHPNMVPYSASKAAQTNMMHSLSLQLASDGITVNNVAPGVIYTDRNTDALSNSEYAKKVMDGIPVGFYGEPNDCAGIISLLCSDEGRYITGQNIFVDGGMGVQ